MKKNPFVFRSFLPVVLMLLFASCTKETPPLDEAEALVATSEASFRSDAAMARDANAMLLQSVRKATSRFHSTEQAIKAGYEPTDHCVSVPGLGGMGYHWLNPSLVDATFDPQKPEAVLYVSGPGNSLQLVAVEYIVLNEGQPAPMFGTQPFDVGGTPVPLPHWSLHVWMYKDNPSGMFIPFNPDVTCP